MNLSDGKLQSLASDLESIGELAPDGRHILSNGKSGPRLIRTSDGGELQGFPKLSAGESTSQAFWLDADRLLYWTNNGQQLKAYTLSTATISSPLTLQALNLPYRGRAYGGRIIYEESPDGSLYGTKLKSAELKPDGQLSETKTLLEAGAREYLSFLYNNSGPLLFKRLPDAGKLQSIGLAETGQVLFELPSAGDKAESLRPNS